MSDSWLAVTYMLIVVVVGAVVAVVLVTRARVAQARADTDHVRHYQELAERCADSQRQLAGEVSRLTERVAAIEKLLREVG
jgi:membrane-bound lytic murein transglycosylase MltF